MKLPARSIILCALALAGGMPPLAQAQFASSSAAGAQDRYDRHTKGTSIEDFVRNLESDDPEKRLQAVKSLGESKESKATEYLLQAVGDPDVRVKAKAIDVLGQMRATEATPVLIQHLFLRTTDQQLKPMILAALGKIGDSRAAAPILEFLQRDLENSTRGTAIFALGEIGAPEASDALDRLVTTEEDERLRRLANDALAKVRHRQATQSAEAKQPSDTFLPKDKPPPE